jgi:cob(I)alamin adenosyltransferase
MESEAAAELTIGEFAAAADVTVRTIRHYEAVGLLEASERSLGGHRRYGGGDLIQLRRILALRRCGFGLESVRRLLDAGSREDALALAQRQLERTELELEIGRHLRLRLLRFTGLLEGSERRSLDELITDMEAEEMNMNLDQISTGLGDAGETDLTDGTRVVKAHPVIAAVGAVEELGAQIGLALARTRSPARHHAWLERIANDLFDIGSDLALPPSAGDGHPRIGPDYVEWLEAACADANSDLDPVDSFVAWFQSPDAARLNVCRVICRRAERAAFTVENANPQIGRYLNRLSDLLFILARSEAAGEEVSWSPGAGAELTPD